MQDINKSKSRIRCRNAGLLIGCTLLLAACAKDNAQSVTLGKYKMTVATDPTPPQVGDDAEFTLKANNPEEALNACQLAFRQYMPEHEMSSDNAWHEMKYLGEGSFRGRGTEFSMGGEWRLEFKLNCGGHEQLAAVPYTLEWPE